MAVWKIQYRDDWRKILIMLLLVAFLGPWTFERIHVPAQYACSSPSFRLEGDFCGHPISGLQLIVWICGGLISMGGELVSGQFVFVERIREFFISLLLLFPLVPVFSTLLLILQRDQPSRQITTILTWVLALGGFLYLGAGSNFGYILRVWGIWFYAGLAVSALILEAIFIREKYI